MNYITVRGFTLEQAAAPWAPPTAEQIGLLGTHWSKGWLIEANTIRYTTCSGVTLGKHGDEFDNTMNYNRSIRVALQRGWDRLHFNGYERLRKRFLVLEPPIPRARRRGAHDHRAQSLPRAFDLGQGQQRPLSPKVWTADNGSEFAIGEIEAGAENFLEGCWTEAKPDLDWFNRPRNPSNPDPDGFDQSQKWQAPEIQLDDTAPPR